jgi:coenzyme PQQ precursor peptide PqqA
VLPSIDHDNQQSGRYKVKAGQHLLRMPEDGNLPDYVFDLVVPDECEVHYQSTKANAAVLLYSVEHWSNHDIVEIAVGLEINSYACAE